MAFPTKGTLKYCYKNRLVSSECNPTSRKMENDVLFHEYSRKRDANVTRKTERARISITSRKKISSNNRDSNNNNTQHLTVDQLTMRTRLQRHSDSFQSIHSSQVLRVFIVFPTGHDVTWIHKEQSL
ncbi:hypothetical protein AVEN_35842-1 [Araneus ventricosus]|uniref:Uncharacterized protein n=1 Tax=Araneus ventricosus TaxID=182803 RepID=A0A4Y2BM81_ARAVE|nr:hypothetical protein AVEN_35842-1 [Araneus ventricosus]